MVNTTPIDLIRDIRSGLLSPGVLELSGATLPRAVELVEDEWLKISEGDPESKESLPPNPPIGMLDAFVRLAQGSSIEKYILKWGALGICQHGLPAEHDPEGLRLMFLNGWEPEMVGEDPYAITARSRRGRCRPGWDAGGGDHLEPVERYVYFARQAHVILTLAAELKDGRPGGEEQWSRLWNGVPKSSRAGKSSVGMTDTELRWGILLGAVNEWKHIGSAEPTLVWAGNKPQFRLDALPFGTLGVQLMFAVSGEHGLAICSECASPYTRKKRMPKKGQNNYCDSCGNQARWRAAKRKKLPTPATKEAKNG